MKKVTATNIRKYFEAVLQTVEKGESIALIKHRGVVGKFTPVTGPGVEISSADFRSKLGESMKIVGNGETVLLTKHRRPAMLFTPWLETDVLDGWWEDAPKISE